MAEKKYYWLKLKETYFDSPKIKMLRKIAGGDTFTIIYLKMQLISIRNEGILKYEGIDVSFADEIALKIDEDVENVKVVLTYLEKQGLLEFNEQQNEMLLTEASESIGSEGESAERVRNFRKKQKALQSNTPVTAALNSNIYSLISNNLIEKYKFSNAIWESINKWLVYKKEKRQTYKETGLKTFLNKIQSDIAENGEQFVIDSIEYSIANNWSGRFEQVKRKEQKQETYVADYTKDFEGVF